MYVYTYTTHTYTYIYLSIICFVKYVCLYIYLTHTCLHIYIYICMRGRILLNSLYDRLVIHMPGYWKVERCHSRFLTCLLQEKGSPEKYIYFCKFKIVLFKKMKRWKEVNVRSKNAIFIPFADPWSMQDISHSVGFEW